MNNDFPEKLYTRRQAICTGAGALAAAGTVLTGSAFAGEIHSAADKAFSFVVVNDLHYRDERCSQWFQKVVESIKKLSPSPAFVMLAGDLSDSGTAAQLQPVRDLFKPLTIPVHTVVGNHDWEESSGFAAYKKFYPGPLNYRYSYGGWEFLALDTTERRKASQTSIPKETLAWVDMALPSIPKEQPIVILTHFPLGHNWVRPMNAAALLDKFSGWNLRATMGGHWHGITEDDIGSIHLSTNRCCSWWHENHDGSPEKGYALAEVAEGKVTHRFIQMAA